MQLFVVCVDDVFGDLVDQQYVGCEVLLDNVIYLFYVVGDWGEQVGGVEGGGGGG